MVAYSCGLGDLGLIPCVPNHTWRPSDGKEVKDVFGCPGLPCPGRLSK